MRIKKLSHLTLALAYQFPVVAGETACLKANAAPRYGHGSDGYKARMPPIVSAAGQNKVACACPASLPAAEHRLPHRRGHHEASSRSASSTFWAVVVATLYSCEIERMLGSRSPGVNSPELILSR
jgi:hypothetical protein